MTQVNYLTAGSRQWGMGHVSRSAGVIQFLRNKGADVQSTVFIPEEDDCQTWTDIIKGYNICIRILSELECQKEFIVIDVPEAIQPDVESFLSEKGITGIIGIGIDWYDESSSIVKSVINLRGEKGNLKYAMIREEFSPYLSGKKNIEKIYGIVVLMGGNDQRGHLKKILEFFKSDDTFRGKRNVIVLGPLVEDDLITQLENKTSDYISVVKDPDNLVDIMASAEIGISNGGTSLLELSALGIPTLIFPQTEQEDIFIKPFLKMGCSELGACDLRSFVGQVSNLWNNNTLLQERSNRAKELIDGKGINRITDYIFEEFGRLELVKSI